MRRWIAMLTLAALIPISMAAAEEIDPQFLNDEQITEITDEVLLEDFSTFTEFDAVDSLFFDDEFGLDSPRIDTDYIWYPINPWLPLVGYPFGRYVSGQGYHLGDDCIRSAGTPIYAIYDGNVRYARYNSGGWGYLMIVESMFNNLVFCTVYGHLGRTMYPGEGRSVGRGQYIGTVGSTGESGQNPPHLHLGIHMGGYDAPTGQYPAWCKGYGTSTNGWLNPTDFIARN